MIWYNEKEPQHLDTRERIVFTWLPLRGQSGIVVWLERVKVFETYTASSEAWTIKSFETISRGTK